MAIAEESEYKGNKMLVLKRDAEDRYPVQFGLGKAKLILESVDLIKAWVEKTENRNAMSRPAPAPSPAPAPAAGGPAPEAPKDKDIY